MTKKSSSLPLILPFLFILLLAWAAPGAAQPVCQGFCNPLVPCLMTCSAQTYTNCLAYNGVCNRDPEGDGVDWLSDNCPETYNPDQTDCDGDGKGDVCDAENAIYARVSGVRCLIDKDVHIPPNYYFDLEDWWDGTYVDQSACNAPQMIKRYKNNEAHCYNVSPYDCCRQLIVNDHTWCSNIDVNFCQGS